MSLFNKLAGAAAGQLLGGDKGQPEGSSALAGQLVTGLIGQSGGVGGLLKSLSAGGLSDQVQSWVGAGENKAVKPSQLEAALGSIIAPVASKLGISTEQASSILAVALPQIINKLTPNGKVESDNVMQSAMSSLMGMLK